MILETGSKILIAHRRLFEGDHARFFVGVVEGYESGIARVSGHTWIRSGYHGEYRRKADESTKIVSLVSGTVILYALPSSVDLGSLRFSNEAGDLYLRDDGGWQMDLSEGVLHGGAPLPSGRMPSSSLA